MNILGLILLYVFIAATTVAFVYLAIRHLVDSLVMGNGVLLSILIVVIAITGGAILLIALIDETSKQWNF